MILDGILLVFQGVLNVILSPLTVVNLGIDLLGSIPIVAQFLQLVAYILPWTNLLPIFALVISLFIFRIMLAISRFYISMIR